jgi:hypothetical protein
MTDSYDRGHCIMIRLKSLALALGLVLLPGCGAAALLTPFIEKAIDKIFDDQSGDLVKDTTEIGLAVELEIALGGRYCCDPANGVNQRVTTLTVSHAGPNGSDPITFDFIPESGSRLTANPATGTLARGEVQTVEVFSSDCDFAFEEFRMRTYFRGDEGVPGRSTTTLLIVTNLCDDATPALLTTKLIAGSAPVIADYVDALNLLELGEAVKHGDVSIADKIPDIPLSQISYYGMLRLSLDATAIDELFTGASALFPVGEGANGSVFEGDTTAAMNAGEYLVGIVAVDGVFDLIDTTREWRFGLLFDSDGDAANNFVPSAQKANDPSAGTDRWYFLDFAPGSGWNMRLIGADGVERATAARVIQFENVLVYVVPASEVPGPSAGYRAVTFTHTGDFGLGADRDWAGDHHPIPNLAPVPD